MKISRFTVKFPDLRYVQGSLFYTLFANQPMTVNTVLALLLTHLRDAQPTTAEPT